MLYFEKKLINRNYILDITKINLFDIIELLVHSA